MPVPVEVPEQPNVPQILPVDTKVEPLYLPDAPQVPVPGIPAVPDLPEVPQILKSIDGAKTEPIDEPKVPEAPRLPGVPALRRPLVGAPVGLPVPQLPPAPAAPIAPAAPNVVPEVPEILKPLGDVKIEHLEVPSAPEESRVPEADQPSAGAVVDAVEAEGSVNVEAKDRQRRHVEEASVGKGVVAGPLANKVISEERNSGEHKQMNAGKQPRGAKHGVGKAVRA